MNTISSPVVQPRLEYPRPHLARNRWLCLNGEWEFAFDAEDAGRGEHWEEMTRLGKAITVPFAYQTALSGLNVKEICEVVWYARDFDLPEAWAGESVLLHFGAVDYEATVWVNGNLVGAHRGGHVSFSFDVTHALRPGPNRVCVRVVDRQDEGQPRGKQASSGIPRGIDYYCTTGIWQSVWLEPVGLTYVSDIVVTSDVAEGAFFVTPVLSGSRAGVDVCVELLDGDQVVASAVSRGLVSGSLKLTLKNPRLWSSEAPFLYAIRIRVSLQGKAVDTVESYAGMRSIELRDGQFLLNGEPVFLRMVLDQGYWPDGGLTAPSDEALRADVEWCKALGFNGARKHQKVEDPRWLYWCDRLGLLVWGEMANARAWSLETQADLEAEWVEAVERDRSHPCIVAWVPVNESMGYPNLVEGHLAQRAGIERLVHLTRRLDPSRPIVDNDGWEQTAASDIVAIHDYSFSGEALASRYPETVAGGPLPEKIWLGSRPTFLPGVEAAGRPVMLTEVGGFLMKPEDTRNLDVMYDIYNSIHTGEELQRKYAELIDTLRTLPFVAGFCYTQLTDVEQELNGLLTYDRRPKVDVARVAEINRGFEAP